MMDDLSYTRVDSDDELTYMNPTHVPNNPIDRYNYFVATYNQDYNRVNGFLLQYAKSDHIFRSLYPFQSKCIFLARILAPNITLLTLFLVSIYYPLLVLIFILSGIALINILYSSYMYFRVMKGKRVSERNEGLIEDPFASMIYSPSICAKEHKIAAYFKLGAKEIYTTGLRSQEIDKLKKKETNGHVEFTVYDDELLGYRDAFNEVTIKRVFIDLIGSLVSCLFFVIYAAVDYTKDT